MNAQPHTHEVRINGDYVHYGDTCIHMIRWFGRRPTAARWDRLVRRVIRRHDRGTLKAAREAAAQREVQSEYNDRLIIASPYAGGCYTALDSWGTDVLDKPKEVRS